MVPQSVPRDQGVATYTDQPRRSSLCQGPFGPWQKAGAPDRCLAAHDSVTRLPYLAVYTDSPGRAKMFPNIRPPISLAQIDVA